MKSEITRPTWEDVIFESRNKEYGAYSIRKASDENIGKASLAMILIALLLIGALQFASVMDVKITMLQNPLPTTPLPPPIVIADPPAKKIEGMAAQTAKSNILERVVTHEVEPVPVEPVETIAITPELGIATGVPMEGTVQGVVDEANPVTVVLPKTVDFAEVMPEYEGGIEAMMKFLRKNLHYPASARRMGIEGSVYVRFVVNSQGEVANVEVLKGISAALDNEATRVIALLNKWRPGRQHGNPVNVRMVLPIKFQLSQ